MDRAKVIEPISGTKLYQERARAALPLLVRQAEAENPITYENLASELGMANARNLNYVLGGIGAAIDNLSRLWKEDIPPVQCLVVNKVSWLPGEGLSESAKKLATYKKLSTRLRRELIRDVWRDVYGYTKWRKVLHFFSLKPAKKNFSELNKKAEAGGRGGGESQEHRRLKNYVLKHPEVLGLPPNLTRGEVEHELPSGDKIDVFFEQRKVDIGIEVKSIVSDVADLTRGLYQCIKYRAVLEARQTANGKPPNARTLLAIEGELPNELVALKNILAVEVVEKVGVKNR